MAELRAPPKPENIVIGRAPPKPENIVVGSPQENGDVDNSAKKSELINSYLASKLSSAIPGVAGMDESPESSEALAHMSPEEAKTALEMMETGARGALKGRTLGASDFALEKGLSAIGANDLSSAAQQRREYLENKYPEVSTASQIVGSVGSPQILESIAGKIPRFAALLKNAKDATGLGGALARTSLASAEGAAQGGTYAALAQPEDTKEGLELGAAIGGSLHLGGEAAQGVATLGKNLADKIGNSTFGKIFNEAKSSGKLIGGSEYQTALKDEINTKVNEIKTRTDLTSKEKNEELTKLQEEFYKTLAEESDNKSEISALNKKREGLLEQLKSTRQEVPEEEIKKESSRLQGLAQQAKENELASEVHALLEGPENITKTELAPALSEAMDKAKNAGKIADLSSQVKDINAHLDEMGFDEKSQPRLIVSKLLSGLEPSSVSPEQLERLRRAVRKLYPTLSAVDRELYPKLSSMVSEGMGQVSDEIKPVLEKWRAKHEVTDLLGLTSGNSEKSNLGLSAVDLAKKSEFNIPGFPQERGDIGKTSAQARYLDLIAKFAPEKAEQFKALSNQVQLLDRGIDSAGNSDLLTTLLNKKQQVQNTLQDLQQSLPPLENAIQDKSLIGENLSSNKKQLKDEMEKTFQQLQDIKPEIDFRGLLAKASRASNKGIDQGAEEAAKQQLLSEFPGKESQINSLINKQQLTNKVLSEPPLSGSILPESQAVSLVVRTPYKLASGLGYIASKDPTALIRKLTVNGTQDALALAKEIENIAGMNSRQKAANIFRLMQIPKNRELLEENMTPQEAGEE